MEQIHQIFEWHVTGFRSVESFLIVYKEYFLNLFLQKLTKSVDGPFNISRGNTGTGNVEKTVGIYKSAK